MDDDTCAAILAKVQCPEVIARDPLYTDEEGRKEICKFSEHLQSQYGAYYRTVSEYTNLFQANGFKILDLQRAFPDELESCFGSKQYIIHAERAWDLSSGDN